MTDETESPASMSGLHAPEPSNSVRDGVVFRELDPDRVLCDATVPAYWNDEVRHSCGHEATVEALWIDGQWHPRCQQHVDGYPANRVRPLGGAS